MGLESIIALFLGVAVLAAKPGPGMVTVASKAIGEGIKPVLFFMVGTNLVKILFFGVAVLGVSFANGDMLFVSILVKSLAAVYLIYIGVQGLQKFDIEMPYGDKPSIQTGFLENFIAGFVMTLSNPFDILFFAGILPTILNVLQISFDDFLLGAFVIVAADSVVALSYAIPLSLSRKSFTESFLKKVNIVSSIMIILVGLYIGYSALPAKDLLSALF